MQEAMWRRQSAETDKLKESLRQLNDKIEEAKRKKNLLLAKQKRAQAQKRIHETMAGLSDRSAFETFDRIADKIEETERRALASAEVSEALKGDSLEDEFSKLEKTDTLDQRLLALKSRMGVLPSSGRNGAALPPSSGPGEAKRLKPAKMDDRRVRDAEIEEEV